MVIKIFYLHSAPKKLRLRKSYVKIYSTKGLSSYEGRFGLDSVERSFFYRSENAHGYNINVAD